MTNVLAVFPTKVVGSRIPRRKVVRRGSCLKRDKVPIEFSVRGASQFARSSAVLLLVKARDRRSKRRGVDPSSIATWSGVVWRSGGVGPVEVRNGFIGVEFLSRDPEVITFSVAFPAYKILQTSPFGLIEETAVEDLFNFPFLFTVDDDRIRRRWFDYAVVVPGAKPVNVDDRVDFEPVWQLKAIVEITDVFQNFERTELRCLLVDLDIFGRESNKITDVKLMGAALALLVVLLHLFFDETKGGGSVIASFSHTIKANFE